MMENKQISIYECAEALELAEYSVESYIPHEQDKEAVQDLMAFKERYKNGK